MLGQKMVQKLLWKVKAHWWVAQYSKSNLEVMRSSLDLHKNTCKKLSPWFEKIRRLMISIRDKGYKIRFTWCPAHKNIYGNEIADRAAKDAALTGESDNEIEFVAASEVISALSNNYD
ncbi:uncharacterized protein LOC105840373 isoform X3 [Monomorium pharaonis]|uniref:uncharacterized protein LOC105840373 isoform X3 n=1 Tax=Monomorium pharaonis TaxID=307658 RepID=UPI0017466A86|nr:uncharacterized protein LOC105840373 isoform X3 [Monomorium pharaonis]